MKPSSHLLCVHFISYLSGAHRHCGQDVWQASGNCRRGAMSSGVPRQLHVPAKVFFTPLVNTFYLLLNGRFACAPSASHSLVKRSLKCLLEEQGQELIPSTTTSLNLPEPQFFHLYCGGNSSSLLLTSQVSLLHLVKVHNSVCPEEPSSL